MGHDVDGTKRSYQAVHEGTEARPVVASPMTVRHGGEGIRMLFMRLMHGGLSQTIVRPQRQLHPQGFERRPGRKHSVIRRHSPS